MDFYSFLFAFWLGFAFAAPPGVINLESIRLGLRHSYRSVIAIGVGSLIGDGAYAVAAFKGLSFVVQDSLVKSIVGTIGVCFLIYLAVVAFRVKKVVDLERDVLLSNNDRAAFLSGIVLSLTNPWAIAFWLSFGGVLISSGLNVDSGNLWFFLISFLAGSTFWIVILSMLVAIGKKFINNRIFRIISFVSGGIFLLTAGFAIWKLIFA
ncbi:MAG: LysE family translocator [Patescibacteria group bacterium]